MKKIMSVMVAAGMITTLSASAFAAEARPAANVPVETFVTDIAEGLDPNAMIADVIDGNAEALESGGVLLIENGGQYSAELGAGLSRTDTRKVSAGDLFAPAQR